MKLLVVTLAATLSFAEAAVAQMHKQEPATPATQGSMDLSKNGPWTRKPTNERKIRQELDAFFKEEERLMKKGDFETALNHIDFPVFMATDDKQGMPIAEPWDREKYSTSMKPINEGMPKDVKHNPTFTVLSDSMAAYVDDFTVKAGNERYTGRTSGLLVKRDGQWKWKAIFEAGWGEMMQPGVGGTGEMQPPNRR